MTRTRAASLAIATGAALLFAGVLGPRVAHAEPDGPVATHPIGAIGAGSELTFGDGPPRQRIGAAATVHVARNLALHAALGRATLDLDRGQLTAGIAYRAAAARPRLELVVHAGAGFAWPAAPAAGAGVTTYLWPTRFPVAITAGLRLDAIIDGLDSGPSLSLGLGLALAR